MSEVIEGARTGGEARPAARLGGELRAVRQRLGWELPDLAGSLRIRQVYLEAIEAGRMVDLPGTTYALGFVRTYASALGLPGEDVAARFREEAEQVHTKPQLSFPVPVPQRGVPAGALMLLGLVILVGAYGGWYYLSEHQHTLAETVPPIPDRLLPAQPRPAPSPQVASILPSASPPAVQTPPPSVTPSAGPTTPPPAGAAAPGVTNSVPPAVVMKVAPPAATPPAAAPQVVSPAGTRVVLKATADAWVTVKQKDGPALFNKLMHAGDSFEVPADKAGLTLTTGNAGGTEVDVDGAPVQGVGGSGMVRRDLSLDADFLKAGHLPPIAHGHPKPPAAPVAGEDAPDTTR